MPDVSVYGTGAGMTPRSTAYGGVARGPGSIRFNFHPPQGYWSHEGRAIQDWLR